MEEMLREGDVAMYRNSQRGRTTALYCIWYINSPAKEVIGLSQDKLPGEAICRCWLAGRGDEG